MSITLRNIVLCAILLHGGNVFAGCSSQFNVFPMGPKQPSGNIPPISDTPLPGIMSANFNTVTDNKNIPIGGVLDSKIVTFTTSANIYCSPPVASELQGTGVRVSPLYDGNWVFKTNLDGVGVRVSSIFDYHRSGAGILIPFNSGAGRYQNPTYGLMHTLGSGSISNVYPLPTTGVPANYFVTSPVGLIRHLGALSSLQQDTARNIDYYVELIKLSNNIQGGTLTGTAYRLSGGSGTTILQIDFGANVIPVTGCTIQTPTNISTPLINVSVDTLRTATMGSSKTFQFIFDCKPGTQVKMTANAGTPVQSSLAGVIGLTPSAATAQGVGIQLLKNDGTPIPLGQEQVYSASTPNGAFTVDMQARYVRIANTVSPGSANGTATFTVQFL